MKMNNQFYIPSTEPLTDVVHSIWQVNRTNGFYREQIIPKGVIEIIFNFSAQVINSQFGDKQYQLPNCFINGFNSMPIQLELPEQQVFFGVQVQPTAIQKLLKAPAALFSNTAIDLTLIDPAFNSLWHELAEQPDFLGRITTFTNWIERKSLTSQPQEKLINQFLYDVHQVDLSVTSLAGRLYYSPRHLSRKIVEATGMNTEEILLYKKYLYAVHLIHHTDLSLTKIAHASNFSDQSHFIRSFKAFTQLTPGEYRRQKALLKGHYYEKVR